MLSSGASLKPSRSRFWRPLLPSALSVLFSFFPLLSFLPFFSFLSPLLDSEFWLSIGSVFLLFLSARTPSLPVSPSLNFLYFPFSFPPSFTLFSFHSLPFFPFCSFSYFPGGWVSFVSSTVVSSAWAASSSRVLSLGDSPSAAFLHLHCGIGAGIVVPLDWWPLTRDCLAYGVTVALMICIIHDERVEWYEALTLVLLYIVYIAVMYWDKSIQRCARGRICMCDRAQEEDAADQEIPAEAGEIRLPLQTDGALAAGAQAQPAQQVQQEQPAQQQQQQLQDSQAQQAEKQQQQQQDSQEQPQQAQQAQQAQLALQAQTPPQQQNGTVKVPIEPNGSDADSASVLAWASLVHWPSERRVWHKALWVAVWPIHLVFLVTIPDCEKPRFKRWFPLTFVMCILWIGSLSYVVAWMITIIGDTLRIPDSVMGITFLAAGTSVPEAVSSVIVAKQGHGSMGISNSIGSNTFDILLCLGLPWLIKASFLPTTAGQHFVGINSRGLEYSAISLLSTLFLLYATFSLNKFKLNRKVGQACLLMYGMFLVLASLIELNVFFMVNLPTCGR